MRIAFDLDGVLADLHRAFTAAAIELFPELDEAALSSPDVVGSPQPAREPASVPEAEAEAATRKPLTSRQRDAVWDHLGGVENFWETLGEIEPGAIRRL